MTESYSFAAGSASLPARHAAQAAPRIGYALVEQFPGFGGAEAFLLGLVAQSGARRVLEVGAGANPTLPPGQVARLGLDYVSSDVSADELGKAGDGHQVLVLDLEHDEVPAALAGSFDLVFSRMVNEHIRDGRRYHGNIRRLLRPDGWAAHCFATLYTLPFVVNRLAPDAVSDVLLDIFSPRDRHQHDKFRAYYSWCRGPTARSLRRFESLGYSVEQYRGYFGHRYYEYRLAPLHRLEAAKARWLTRHPLPELCSFASVVLRNRAPAA